MQLGSRLAFDWQFRKTIILGLKLSKKKTFIQLCLPVLTSTNRKEKTGKKAMNDILTLSLVNDALLGKRLDVKFADQAC